MSGRRDESLLLDDMADAVGHLIELGATVADGCLGQDRALNEQILWNLIVLGEAAKRLARSTRERFPDVVWSDIAQTRDRIIHHYDGIDWLAVRRIIELDLSLIHI